jgi:anhydro-N-acetylmuramic acid kinase
MKMRVIGLMSGTSLDGIDVALLDTDGEGQIDALGFESYSMPMALAKKIREFLDRAQQGTIDWTDDPEVEHLRAEITQAHIDAIRAFRSGRDDRVDLIGFHGQTVWHDPAHHLTVQLSDGLRMARAFKVPVVDQFRINDVAAGGQGAPLAPLFHAALCAEEHLPCAVINIGGVANMTFLGNMGEILAFDTGPGNALLNDWMMRHTGQNMDRDGALAREGRFAQAQIDRWLEHPYFKAPAPKSLDRNHFVPWNDLANFSAADGAAHLAQFTAQSIARATDLLPHQPDHFIVCGGGRHNAWLMHLLGEHLAGRVFACEHIGWDGDALEAQAFAWLAVRSMNGMVLSLPETTGVTQPLSGGRINLP